jgi:outer membrane protein insertion porin family
MRMKTGRNVRPDGPGAEASALLSFGRFACSAHRTRAARICTFFVLICSWSIAVSAQNKYEDRVIVSPIQIVFEGTDRDVSAADQLRLIAESAVGDHYSAVHIREAIQALYDTEKIVSARAEATPVGQDRVNLRFIIKRKTQADKVFVHVGTTVGERVTEDQILLRVNILNPGTSVTDLTLRNNADQIQAYLRDRGFYKAEVSYTTAPTSPGNETRVAATFQVTPGAQARVEQFNIAVEGFDDSPVRKDLKLQPGTGFSRRALDADVAKIRKAILKQNYLAPTINEPKFTYDADKNTIDIEVTGGLGPKVNVKVESGAEKVNESTQTQLLPIRREGTLDYSAIIEGSRRLRNYFQQRGYFFVEVNAICSTTPPLPSDDTNKLENGTDTLCGALSGADLDARTVGVTYQVNLNRRLRLTDIRIEGTDKLTIEDIASVLDTQRASALGLIPKLGYGRGYTSNEILEADRARVQSLMRELGYRRAKVTVRQGVSPAGEDLIITFVVDEGPVTTISDIEITGNKFLPTDRLMKELPPLTGKNYSRARARNGVQKLSALYANEGYYDARVSFSIVDLPPQTAAAGPDEHVKVIYNIETEGKKVYINRIILNGNEFTKRESILRAITLREGELLKAADISLSEQNLYATDAFTRVEIKAEPAGETTAGDGQRDIIINIEEQKPRILNYGGGYSTDGGPFGSFDIRHVNLFGKLQTGGILTRMSRRQQLVQMSFVDPRFMGDGKNRFAPLSITAQYQRDSTVTRFFRSAFDQGTFGIVQRIDEHGNPIDEFGRKTGSPTINRLTLTAETQRTLSREARSIVFLRFRFEDVRLFQVESLLIKDLLLPDARIRTSGVGVTFVRDTRENCARGFSLLELISKGEVGDPCKYNPTDPTRGSYITAEYNISVPALGANIGFHKFQGTYQTYYSFPRIKNLTLAARGILGLASVFSSQPRFPAQFSDLNSTLPISERFFAGGSTTLRGFEFDSAGPRIVVLPQGVFRNTKGEQVFLSPFTVPFGGNALAIVNLEARLPVSNAIQVVPFYDGGNVFLRVKDLFHPATVDPTDVVRSNLSAEWSHTVGLGLRIKAPIGGSFAVDFGYLTNPPRFLIPQAAGGNAIYQVRQTQVHFRFTQTF